MSSEPGGSLCVETLAGVPGRSADISADAICAGWVPCGGVSDRGHHPMVHGRHQVLQREHTGE